MNVAKDDLKQAYLKWLAERIKLRDLNDVIEITTPMIDRHNDFLQIYVTKSGDMLRLTDDGYVIGDLLMSGVDVQSSPNRRRLLMTILKSFGVNLSSHDELYIDSRLDDFPKRKHMLLQAMLAVNDMFFTSRTTVSEIFYEDVENYLIMNEIRYTDNVVFSGKSGFTHRFDFVIPRSKHAPERIIQAVNTPNKNSIQNVIFTWDDTKESRKPDSTLYAFLNDADHSVSSDLITALEKYEVRPVLWSQRNQYTSELVA